jgi:peptidoglycan/LPS O-acetylase OafA/YrhL
MKADTKIYFPGLNGLRCIAAFMVIIGHIEWLKKCSGLSNLEYIPFIEGLADNGVTLFFVLSGFLITYLLLSEKKLSGSIHIKHFFMRRILRIWPLYYVILLLSFFVFPLFIPYPGLGVQGMHAFHFNQFVLYFFLFPNVSNVLISVSTFANPLWSLGVEEQFYFIWPFVLTHCKKYLLSFLTLFSVLLIIFRKLFFLLRDNLEEGWIQKAFGLAAQVLQALPFECMCIGAMAAVVLFQQQTRLLQIIYSRWFQLLLYLLLLLSLLYNYQNHLSTKHIINSLLFAALILNIASNKKSFLKLNNPIADFLGKISYGMYLFHFSIVCAVIAFVQPFIQSPILFNMIVYGLVALCTISVSYVSYRYFESPFLKRKLKYSMVQSAAQQE